MRYVRKADGHWCDRVDQSLKLTPNTRHRILDWTGFFTAWQEICKAFPSDPSVRDNSWCSQPLFQNSNVKTKIPTNNAAGFKLQPLNPRYFGIPETSNIKIIDVFSACRFISQEQLETLVHRDEDEADFRLEEGSFLRLKRAVKFITGMR